MSRLILPATLAAALILGGMSVAEARGTMPGGGGGQAVQPMMDDVATVTVNDRVTLQIAAAGNMTAQQRAEIVRDRIRMAIQPREDQAFRPITREDVTIRMQNNMPVIRLRDRDLLTITHMDARAMNMASPNTVAQRLVNELRVALADVQLGAGERLPEDFVIVRTGGGAGTTPEMRQDDMIDQQRPEEPMDY